MSLVPSLIHPSRVGHACPSLVLLLITFALCTAVLADVPGLRFLRHPESAVAMPGADVTFECALNVSADRVEWRHRGRPLVGNRSQGGGGRLVVHLAQDSAQYAEQSGTYQCVAWFGASAMASLPAELQVATLQQVPRNQFSMRPVQVVVAPGNVVPFSCPPPPSIPPAQVRFAKNDNPITGWVSPWGTMLLPNVTTADSGIYSCSATNSFMDKTVTLPYTFELSVEPSSTNLAPHYITSEQHQINYTVTAGTDTKLMCPVVGWPVPSMTWSKYGGSLSPERTTMVPGALMLSSVTHADEGTYLCEASNGINPRIKCIVMLYVQEPPSIVTEPQSMTVEEGGEVLLECAAKGHPTPVISWLQNGESVEKDSDHIFTAGSGSRLYIKPVEKRHAGMFQCFATNSLGNAFGLAMLQVQPRPITSQPTYEETNPGDDNDEHPKQGHKPKRRPNKTKPRKAIMIPPSKPNITRLSDESVMVRWSVSSEEGLPIQFFKVQYRDLGMTAGRSQWQTIDADIPPHIRSYEVDNLKTNHLYRFRIAAVYSNNDNKLSLSSARFQLQKEAATKRPLYPPNLTRAYGISPSAIKIEWQYSEVPSTPIEGFFIYYRSTTMAGDYTKATVLGENTETYTITHLLPDNSYDIKVQSFNIAGTSDFSSIRSSRTQYVPTTTEPGRGGSSPSVPEGGLNIPMGNEGGSQHLTMVVGTVLGGLALLLLLLSVGVYLCRQTGSRTAAADHDQAKEVQAYGLAAVGNPLTNGTNHHLHLHHRHLASPRVHITANPLAATDLYKSDGELEVSSQNNNCAALLEPSRRRRRLASVNDSTDEGEDEEEETPPPPLPRGHCENYV